VRMSSALEKAVGEAVGPVSAAMVSSRGAMELATKAGTSPGGLPDAEKRRTDALVPEAVPETVTMLSARAARRRGAPARGWLEGSAGIAGVSSASSETSSAPSHGWTTMAQVERTDERNVASRSRCIIASDADGLARSAAAPTVARPTVRHSFRGRSARAGSCTGWVGSVVAATSVGRGSNADVRR
jgi:hypothetical protein